MNNEVGCTRFTPETSSTSEFDNHAGSRDATSDFEVGCRPSRWGGLASREARVAASAERAVTEAEFQRAVIEAAHVLGWRVAHFRPARTAHGWRTPVEADGAGFPDVVLVRERVLFVELKSATTRVTPEQRQWLDALDAAGAEAYLWRPDHWDDIQSVLRGRAA
jgi:VRR-NUC domain